MRSYFIVILLVFLFGQCKVRKNRGSELPPDFEKPWEEVVHSDLGPVNQPVYNASRKRIVDIVHTALHVSFDWKKEELIGRAEIDLKPYLHPTKEIELDAKFMTINEVKFNYKNDRNKVLEYVYDGLKLKVLLPYEIDREDKIELVINYVAHPNNVTQIGSEAITSAKGLYFINSSGDSNKHQEVWTQGETESNSVWFPTIDSPNEKCTQEMYITVEDRFTTLSNGVMEASERNADGTRTDYWRMDQPHAPYLFMMAIGEYEVVEDTWIKSDGTELPVDYYVEKKYEEHARAIFGDTPEMLSYFSELLGVEYPWPKYAQVVVRDFVSGAMENTTATIHGDFLYRTKRELIDANNESIIAHELFHHWFGDLVTCESWANLPLNESFANYSQYLWDEHKYGRMEADKNAFDEMEGYFLGAESGGHMDMIRYDYASKEDMFDGHSYNKGGRILHMLRTYLGDEVFFESLKNYLNNNAYSNTEIHNLRMEFEKVSGEDLNWFFNQWFLASGHPEVVIQKQYFKDEKELLVTVDQIHNTLDRPLYQLPIKIDIYTGNGVVSKSVWVKNASERFVFSSEEAPVLVNVDAEKVMLWKKQEYKPVNEWAKQLELAPLWLDKKEAIENLKESKSKEAAKALKKALDEPFYDVQLMVLDAIENAVKIYPEEIKLKLKNLAVDANKSQVRSKSLKKLIQFFPKDLSNNQIIAQALSDSSYLVMSTALISKSKITDDLTFVKKYEKFESADISLAVAKIYSDSKNAAHNKFYKSMYNELNAENLYDLMGYHFQFLMNQDLRFRENGLEDFENIIRSDHPWYIRVAGYQLVYGLKRNLSETYKELQKVIATDQGTPSIEKIQAEKDMDYCERKIQRLDSILDKYLAIEKDPNVLKYIK